MKQVAVGLVWLALGVAWANAGYESISPPGERGRQRMTTSETASGIVNRAAWTGGIVLADGTEIKLENAGGHFLPVRLESGIQCRMWVAGPGLVPGRSVVLFTRCGGFINGSVKDAVTVGADGCLRFNYQNGVFGSQPIQAALMGNTATLLTVNATKNSQNPPEEEAHETK